MTSYSNSDAQTQLLTESQLNEPFSRDTYTYSSIQQIILLGQFYGSDKYKLVCFVNRQLPHPDDVKWCKIPMGCWCNTGKQKYSSKI